jgi:hypothetical protein
MALIAIGMMFIPIINSGSNNGKFTKVTAQSQSATVQQKSQPPSPSQNPINSTQIGQVFTFHEKSRPPMILKNVPV